MIENPFLRTELLLGTEGMARLEQSAVAIFGVGGVGSYTAEALARSGVGEFALFDDDLVSVTNINRQLIATTKTVGQKKVEVMKERILEINPLAKVTCYPCFYTPENADQFDLSGYSYIVDAIDTVSAKLELIMRAKAVDIPIMSSMGAGNKLDPTQFEVADIHKTSVCPLAKVIRHELKKRRVKKLKVVYSKELIRKPLVIDQERYQQELIGSETEQRKGTVRRQVPASIAFVPSVAGLIIAGEVIKDLTGVR